MSDRFGCHFCGSENAKLYKRDFMRNRLSEISDQDRELYDEQVSLVQELCEKHAHLFTCEVCGKANYDKNTVGNDRAWIPAKVMYSNRDKALFDYPVHSLCVMNLGQMRQTFNKAFSALLSGQGTEQLDLASAECKKLISSMVRA